MPPFLTAIGGGWPPFPTCEYAKLQGLRSPLLTVDRSGARRVASLLSSKPYALIVNEKNTLEIDDKAKKIVHEIGTAINSAVEDSSRVADAIERLRDAGYEMELTLRLEIGLRPHDEDGSDDETENAELDLTDEDVRTLRRMKIRIDEPEMRDD